MLGIDAGRDARTERELRRTRKRERGGESDTQPLTLVKTLIIVVMRVRFMREYRRAILASDDELNVQTQRLAFGVRISLKRSALKRKPDRRERRCAFYIVYHSYCRIQLVRKRVHGLYGIDMAREQRDPETKSVIIIIIIILFLSSCT